MQPEEKINQTINEAISELSLPEGSVYLFSNRSGKGEKKGTEVSKTLCISEPEYPPQNAHRVKSKSCIVLNLKMQNGFELLVKKKQFEALGAPQGAVVKETPSDKGVVHVLYDEIVDEMLRYLRENISYCVNNYKASASFGCCSRFEECSAAGQCVHVNKLYAKGCAYRKNLEQGQNFLKAV